MALRLTVGDVYRLFITENVWFLVTEGGHRPPGVIRHRATTERYICIYIYIYIYTARDHLVVLGSDTT
jgi:hypothetical protein